MIVVAVIMWLVLWLCGCSGHANVSVSVSSQTIVVGHNEFVDFELEGEDWPPQTQLQIVGRNGRFCYQPYEESLMYGDMRFSMLISESSNISVRVRMRLLAYQDEGTVWVIQASGPWLPDANQNRILVYVRSYQKPAIMVYWRHAFGDKEGQMEKFEGDRIVVMCELVWGRPRGRLEMLMPATAERIGPLVRSYKKISQLVRLNAEAAHQPVICSMNSNSANVTVMDPQVLSFKPNVLDQQTTTWDHTWGAPVLMWLFFSCVLFCTGLYNLLVRERQDMTDRLIAWHKPRLKLAVDDIIQDIIENPTQAAAANGCHQASKALNGIKEEKDENGEDFLSCDESIKILLASFSDSE